MWQEIALTVEPVNTELKELIEFSGEESIEPSFTRYTSIVPEATFKRYSLFLYIVQESLDRLGREYVSAPDFPHLYIEFPLSSKYSSQAPLS